MNASAASPLATSPAELIGGAAAARPLDRSLWALALRRLSANRGAIVCGAVFALLAISCIAAPLWSNQVAHRSPTDQPGTGETVSSHGKQVEPLSIDGIPIGPTWHGEYFLGADASGRDIMVRLLYGGRNSLLIGISAALLTTVLASACGLLAGYFRGWVDAILARLMDLIWAFPVILLGVALGTVLSLSGLSIGPLRIESGSLALPIAIIAFVHIPYLARPIRGEVMGLREQEFVTAARAQGMSSWQIIRSEIVPNLTSLIVTFFPLILANAILLESALSFLGAGVQPPNPSWGTLIDDGVARIISAPHLAIVPGAMLALSVLSLNVFGDGVRDALDPRGTPRRRSRGGR